MTTVKITDAGGNKPTFVQWDVDRVLYVSGVASQPCLHFANAELKRAIVVQATDDNGRWKCKVPNFILQFACPIAVSVFTQPEGGEGRTEATVVFGVQPKKKPQDYTYEENIGYINWIEKSKEVQDLIDTIQGMIDSGDLVIPDGSLTEQKFSDALKIETIKDYVTPEMFGAKGDGVADDSEALQAAIDSGKPVYLPAGTYNVVTPLFVSGIAKLELANGATIKAVGNDKPYLIGMRNDGKSYPLAEKEYIKGGVIDGNGLCDVVIGVNYSHGMIERCIVKGIKHYGIYNLHNLSNPNAGSGNMLLFHVRLLGDPTLSGTIGFGQGGGDCVFICTTAQDVETGFQVGSDKLSDCHAWISRNDIFDNSTAFEIIASGGQLVNCVSDTMRYGIKSALNYAKFTVTNFSFYFNLSVTPTAFLNDHQPTVFNLTGDYPLAVFTNIEINLAACSGKITNDKLATSTTAKFVCLSLNGMDNAVSANTPFDVATPYNVIRSVSRSGNITLDELNDIAQTCIVGGYSAITGLTGWATVVTSNVDGGTFVQTISVAGIGSKTRRKASGSWSEFA